MAYPGYGAYVPFQAQPQIQPMSGYIWVAGLEGAQAYFMPPNSRAPLFDTNSDQFFDVSTDANGQKTINAIPFNNGGTAFATKEDVEAIGSKLDEVMEAITNVKQPVLTPEPKPAKPDGGNARAGKSNGARKSARSVQSDDAN